MTKVPFGEELKDAAQRLQALPGIVFERNPEGDRAIYFLSQGCLALTEYTVDELLSLSPGSLSFNDLILPEDLVLLFNSIDSAVSMQQPYRAEYRIHTKSGNIRWFLEQGYCSDSGTLEGLITDISEQKQFQSQLQQDAFYDQLTGLPNRGLFLDRLAHAVHRLQRYPNYQFAVLFLDLDRFKVINDSLGHRAGDALLVKVAARLKACVRPEDTVARIGGDEFTMLLHDVHGYEEVALVGDRILKDMGQRFQIEDQEIFTTTSIGIALSSPSYTEAEDLIRDADIALYQAKAMGKACYALYQSGMHIHAVARLQLENDLRRALSHKEFCLLYQPIVRLETGKLVGFETFVYWQHPTRGLLAPGEFLPVALEAGLMVAIGHWVIETACQQMALWHRQFAAARSIFVGINLSSPEISHPDLVPVLEQSLQKSGLLPQAIKIEITENTLVNQSDTVLAKLRTIKALGIQLCIDDFGTGYSSLSYLDQFPVDFLKVDQSFVARIDSAESLEIIRTILTLAENLNLKAVAEGVEAEWQIVQLRALRCEFGQGFAFAKPVDALQAVRILEQQFLEDDFTALTVALPRLLIRSTMGLYQLLLVGRMSWLVGRAQDCSIFLADRMISREHAMILQMAQSNDFYWVDLGSRNGSFINYQRVTRPTQLHDGDLIRVGNKLELQFVATADSAQLPHATHTVLMYQPSLLQAQIWREVLMTQKIAIIWQASDVPLLHTLRQLLGAGEALPCLLLVDLDALREDIFEFLRVLDRDFDAIPVMLTKAEPSANLATLRQQVREAGAVDLVSAFHLEGADFFDYRADVARKAFLVLRALDPSFKEDSTLIQAADVALKTVLRNQTLF